MVKTNRQRYTYEGEMQCEKESKAERELEMKIQQVYSIN